MVNEEKDKKINEIEENTKKTADNMIVFLYSSIQTSEKNNEILKAIKDEVKIKD